MEAVGPEGFLEMAEVCSAANGYRASFTPDAARLLHQSQTILLHAFAKEQQARVKRFREGLPN